jgi:N-methylhydantoinase B/oxoprolinase/acetone carboxylase alpha subunit
MVCLADPGRARRRALGIMLWTPGGGGYGDPKKRDRDSVEQDVAEGYVSEEAARNVYGFNGSGNKVA